LSGSNDLVLLFCNIAEPKGGSRPKMSDMDWNDLRFFLAVAREGSTLAAGRSMRVSQTTVARRIAALEGRLGFPLFDKRQAGYSLTAAGEALLGRAEDVERTALAFGDAASAHARQIAGTVRITTEEVYATTLLAPMLAELHQLHPEIRIDLDTSQTIRDLGAGEADVSLRSTSEDQPAGVVGRKLGIDDWALYCSRDYAAKHGAPATLEELRQHPIIGGGGGNLWRNYQAWLQLLGLEDSVAMHHASSGGLLSGVRSGFGIAVLPCVVADADPELHRCIPPRTQHGRVLWLFTHERVRHSPPVRTVLDFLYERLRRHVLALEEKRAAA
jgi:DNA-binding transcriptional LysR family regulator